MPTDLKKLRQLAKKDDIATGQNWTDRGIAIPNLISPTEVKNRISSAQSGDLGPLQEIYLLMDTDSRYSGIVNSLYASVINCPIKVMRADKDTRDSRRAHQLAQQMFGIHRLSKAAVAMAFAKTYIRGTGIYEINWDIMKGTDGRKYIFPTSINVVPPTRYLMETNYADEHYSELKIQTLDEPAGLPLSAFPYGKIIALSDGTDPGFYDLAGAARRCLRWWLTKKYTELWWNQYNETYGEPARVAYVPPGSKRSASLQRFLKELGRSMYGIFDSDVEIDFLNNSLGTPATYKQIIDLANAEIAVAIHGQTQTTDGGEYGSYAKAKVQLGVRLEIVQLVCQIVQTGLQELLKYFITFNLGENFDPSLMPEIKPVVRESEDKQMLANVFDRITKIIPVPTAHIYESLEIPQPEDGEETIGPEDRVASTADQFSQQGSNPQIPGKQDSQSSSDSSKGEDSSSNSTG